MTASLRFLTFLFLLLFLSLALILIILIILIIFIIIAIAIFLSVAELSLLLLFLDEQLNLIHQFLIVLGRLVCVRHRLVVFVLTVLC